MLQKIKQWIQLHHLIEKKDRIVIGVSGGADSVCLFYVLNSLKEEMDLNLCVVHINHGIRGEEALRDQEFVKALAAFNDIPYIEQTILVEQLAREHGWTPEEAGRNARYQKFNEVCEEFHYHKIAVAHNQNDQAETVIHQMSRGCRLSGLTAMEPKTGRVIRPLLTCSRLEIENYLSEKKYNFMNDSTNVGNDYTRNRIRHHVLPLLEEEVHQGATKHIASMALELQELEQFLQKEIVKIYTKFATVTETSISFQIDHLNSLDSYLLKEVLRYAFVQLCGQRKDITSSHIEAMSAIIDSSGTKEIYLPYQVKVHKNYETYFLIQENKCLNKQENHKLIKDTFLTEISNVRQMITVGDYHIEFQFISLQEYEGVKGKKYYTKWFDYDKIKGIVSIRNPKKGDYIQCNSQGMTKKLSRYFIDQKIPLTEREEQLVIAVDSHVLWLNGYRTSEAFHITQHTQTILQITIKEIRRFYDE